MTITPISLSLHRISRVAMERFSSEGAVWTKLRFMQGDHDGNEVCVLETVVFTTDNLPIMWEVK